MTSPFNVVSLSLHSWKMKWNLLKGRFLIQGKGCWLSSQVLIMAFFSCVWGWQQRGGGRWGGGGRVFSATLAGLAKNGKKCRTTL